MLRRNPLKTFVVVTLLLVVPSLIAETKIYKVIKADGSVVYTDKPPPGAKEFQIKTKANVVPSVQTDKKASVQNANAQGEDHTPSVNYDFKIIKPGNEQTIRSNEGIVDIEASLTPPAFGSFELLINGETVAVGSAPRFNVQGLDRGEHNIKINFLDQTGKLLASTPPSRFYIQKVSALLRAN